MGGGGGGNRDRSKKRPGLLGHPRLLLALLALHGALFAPACVKRDILARPALLDMTGRTVSLLPIDHNGHPDLAAAVREACDASFLLVPRHTVVWAKEGGELNVFVSIVAVNRTSREQTFATTCTRTVPGKFTLECDANDVCAQKPLEETFACKKVERVQDVSARFNVELREPMGAVRFRHTYHISVVGSSFADRLLAGRLSEQLVRLVSPWYHTMEADESAFARDCRAGSTRCAEAHRAFMEQDFQRADALLTAELGPFVDRVAPVPASEAPSIAKALCNRGLAREYQQIYDLALSDYRRAAVLGADRRCMVLLERLENYSQARAAFGANHPAY